MTRVTNHTTLSKSILKTLLYFDIFQYPLTASEIFKHLHTNHVTLDHVSEELTKLCNQSMVFPIHNFFSVQNNPGIGERRIRGNQLAAESLSIAKKQAQLISKFPFVRAVMVSGSLSKDYMDESSDLDFFVITKPNRLWTAKAILMLYKKTFLLNSHKYFCINYFIDEIHLEIEEKNVFTATELATLLPLYGKEHYLELMNSNKWIEQYLPNHYNRSLTNVQPSILSTSKKIIEALLNFSGADWLEKKSRAFYSNRLIKRHQRNYSKRDLEIAFKTKEHTSKWHAKNHQRKVIDLYQQKIEEFGNKMNINWND